MQRRVGWRCVEHGKPFEKGGVRMEILVVIFVVLGVLSVCTLRVRSAGFHAVLAACFFVLTLLFVLEWAGRLHL